jgi:signal transduction histidine kinase
MNNIVRHSGASEVHVSLQRKATRLKLAIQDNGQWKSKGIGSGTGLSSMQQRAEALGGSFEISHSDKGTTVCLYLPLT